MISTYTPSAYADITKSGTKAEKLLALLDEFIWPTRCAICDVAGYVVCPRCVCNLPYIDMWGTCPRCGEPYAFWACTHCARQREQGVSDRLFCIGCIHTNKASLKLIKTFKDMGEQRLAKAIALLMYEYIEHMSTIDAIVFIPNRKRALLKRGFDHMKLIAYALSELMDAPVAQILIANETKDQRVLNRMQRQANAQHMFDATEDISYKHILLIDDVFTTGATLQHGQTCLLEHGAKKVTCLTLMRS